jgi:hypothetical protein
MARTPVQECLLNDYFDQGLSYSTLEAKYGRSEQSIRRLVRAAEEEGRKRTKAAADRRSIMGDVGPLSPMHRRLGTRLVRWRTIDNNHTPTEASKLLGVSLNRLHTMEGGIHNWTLLELHYLAERMGVNPIELIRDTHEGDFKMKEKA